MSLELALEIQRYKDLLDVSPELLTKHGREFAEARKAYQVALAEKELELRADGMPAVMCQDLARGDDHVANLRMAKDCAEAVYKAAQESINIYKLNIRILEAQIDREFRG